MDEKTTNALDKLLGLNSSAVIALGMAAGGLIVVGSILGSYANRLDAIERTTETIATCASKEHCESVTQRVYELRERIARLETLNTRGTP